MQFSLALLALLAGVGVAALNLYTTWLCLKHYRPSLPERVPLSPKSGEPSLSPVSILKPLKGGDNGLKENLESFFAFDYPEYELIFSVADEKDPALQVARELIARHCAQTPDQTRVNPQAHIIVGDVDAGANPKVNNLIRSYAAARHELILISDSNVRVDASYLRRCVALMAPGVGVVTAAVAGVLPRGIAGLLDATYLNTFYARWMVAAGRFGFPTVIGKSMLFAKSVAERFGGLPMLSPYLAEDYMTGQVMRHLGLQVRVMREPVPQVIGRPRFLDYWQRHIRWGRMRKTIALLPFLGEAFASSVGSGALLALGLRALTGSVPGIWLFLHFATWFACDLAVMARMGTRTGASAPLCWVIRELLALPMWLHVMCGNTVLWRGTRLRLEAGSVLDCRFTKQASEC